MRLIAQAVVGRKSAWLTESFTLLVAKTGSGLSPPIALHTHSSRRYKVIIRANTWIALALCQMMLQAPFSFSSCNPFYRQGNRGWERLRTLLGMTLKSLSSSLCPSCLGGSHLGCDILHPGVGQGRSIRPPWAVIKSMKALVQSQLQVFLQQDQDHLILMSLN